MIGPIKSQIEAISDARWALMGNGSVHTAAGTPRSPRGGLLSMCRQTGSRCVCLRVCLCVCCPVSSFSLHGRGRVGDAASAERSEQTHLRDLCLNAV